MYRTGMAVYMYVKLLFCLIILMDFNMFLNKGRMAMDSKFVPSQITDDYDTYVKSDATILVVSRLEKSIDYVKSIGFAWMYITRITDLVEMSQNLSGFP